MSFTPTVSPLSPIKHRVPRISLSVLFLPLLLPTRPQHEEIGNATSTRRRRTAAARRTTPRRSAAASAAVDGGGAVSAATARRSAAARRATARSSAKSASGDAAEVGSGRRWSRQVRRRPRQVVSAEGRRSAAASAGCLGGGARTAAASAGCLGDAGKVGGRRRRWSAPALDLGALRKSDAGGEEKSRIGREGERIEGKAVGPTIGQAFLAGYIWPVQGELWPVDGLASRLASLLKHEFEPKLLQFNLENGIRRLLKMLLEAYVLLSTFPTSPLIFHASYDVLFIKQNL